MISFIKFLILLITINIRKIITKQIFNYLSFHITRGSGKLFICRIPLCSEMLLAFALLALLSFSLAQNLVFTQDYNTNGRICLSGNCLSSADVAYLKTQQPESLSVSFRTATNSSNFIYTESTATNNYTIKRMTGSTTPDNFTFTPVAQKLISPVGCYLISGSTLVLERNNGNLSSEECYETAARQGDLYFAVQQYGRCSSGNSTNYDVNGLNLMLSCMYSCTLNAANSTVRSSMACGDNTAAAVYQINHAASQVISSSSISNGTMVRFSHSFQHAHDPGRSNS